MNVTIKLKRWGEVEVVNPTTEPADPEVGIPYETWTYEKVLQSQRTEGWPFVHVREISDLLNDDDLVELDTELGLWFEQREIDAQEDQGHAELDRRERELTDVEADADTLRSAGWGTDEDYGSFSGEEE